VRIGAQGAQLMRGGELITVPRKRVNDVVDEVGAGDAFAAGFAFELLRGGTPVDAVRTGHRLAGAALPGSRDWERRLVQLISTRHSAEAMELPGLEPATSWVRSRQAEGQQRARRSARVGAPASRPERAGDRRSS
jgi:hypothetical protein